MNSVKTTDHQKKSVIYTIISKLCKRLAKHSAANDTHTVRNARLLLRLVNDILAFRMDDNITSHHMENTEAGLQRPLFLRNRLKTDSI